MASCLKKICLFLTLSSSLFSIATGNPGEAALMKKGVIMGRSSWSFRVGYMGDYVYKQRFQDEFEIQGCKVSTTFVKMYTNAGLVTLNLKKRLDLYGILGATRLQIDEEAFSKTRFGWGLGARAIIFHSGRFFIGADLKYYESDQKPLYFLCEHLPYNIVNDYILNYREIQGSVGITHRTKYIAPYINATYINSKIDPNPSIALVKVPDMDFLVDVPSKSVISQKRWGFSVGATLIDQRTATLSVEWRALNQNSVDVLGELRF